MPRKSLNVDNLSREGIRKKILETWIQEDPATGQHRYDVETCRDGSGIYLLRPAYLNKGCDFVIVSEKFVRFKNGKDRPPNFDDVFNLIESFCRGNSTMIEMMQSASKEVYGCAKPDDVIDSSPLKAVANCAAERALKLLKWMWIEQDVTYWTQQGRTMLWGGLSEFFERLA